MNKAIHLQKVIASQIENWKTMASARNHPTAKYTCISNRELKGATSGFCCQAPPLARISNRELKAYVYNQLFNVVCKQVEASQIENWKNHNTPTHNRRTAKASQIENWKSLGLCPTSWGGGICRGISNRELKACLRGAGFWSRCAACISNRELKAPARLGRRVAVQSRGHLK